MPEREDIEQLDQLGSEKTSYTFEYDPSLLETFENTHPYRDYFVKFNCPEFTTLCPKTGQPDFGTLYISYIPDEKMVESKSLKLYLFSFRNHGGFHEDSINTIVNDLVHLMNPRYLEIWGKFTPRGGISIDPFVNYGRAGSKYEQLAENRLFQHDLYPEPIDNR
ncbi:NADPH-dependent 7-cyano-7-deazaguanine reductase QueF [Marinococcus halophilus]|uniref:NADPH-dependent 7-cyano-7-deazaguanine reductase n=1 Tax=Marinococcus halophilus TaxID=1371 RepID=A0A510Y3Y5_MARHA|nr:preQ(1) synthase [Marinococcus halophilus]OZT80052.1 NADPH-dependent 7-cyano-7-deazaguanine reductase QueF [Marinococcus halophilus]GEK58025.1 NADPH-dependent 7-cyano-7-deazaguanine reductase [Marinococcus halophilus]